MIKLVNLTKVYNLGERNETFALDRISFEIADGEMVAVIGKSGSGKSTLMHILACIIDYEEGEYYLDNILIQSLSDNFLAQLRNEKIGFVIQDFALIEIFNALENVMMPLDFSSRKKNKKMETALQALKDVGMETFADQHINQMSGGQKQRVAIARAIVNNPRIILADEPTGALDTVTASEIISLFRYLNSQGKTVIIVTHDMEIAQSCDRVLELRDGMLYDSDDEAYKRLDRR